MQKSVKDPKFIFVATEEAYKNGESKHNLVRLEFLDLQNKLQIVDEEKSDSSQISQN